MQNNKIHTECDYHAAHRRAGLPELLAPAGSYEHLKAAIKAGADAVYMGGAQFGARAYADNLNAENLRDALHYAHFHGRRLYLTVNTLMKEHELNQILYGFILPYYEAGLDGVIVQDLGTASFIHEHFPDMEVHASTQMTITHSAGALAAGQMGMTRVVPARELSLKELKAMKEESGLELEVFVHGALCFCYSGQCLLSSWYGGRSGNRGRCAQPCRLRYSMEPAFSGHGHQQSFSSKREGSAEIADRKACFLSPRDLCALPHLPALVEAGVDSLKIEGRMKNVEYVAGVTAIYRKYLNLYASLKEEGHQDSYQVLPEDIYALQELYCRGDFTDGYLFRHNGPGMMAFHTQKNTGRKIGLIRSVGKHNIRLDLEADLHPKDILVIPLEQDEKNKHIHNNKYDERDEEVILTVPSGISVCPEKTINLNVPNARRLRPGMPVYRRRNEDQVSKIRQDYVDAELRYPVDMEVTISQDNPSGVRLSCRGLEVLVEGQQAQPAKKRAVSKEDVRQQFGKTGATPFLLRGCEIKLQEESFLPLSALKQLRQQAYQALEEMLKAAGDRQLSDGRVSAVSILDIKENFSRQSTKNTKEDKYIYHSIEKTAVVYDKIILDRCLSLDFYTAICLPMDSWALSDLPELSERIRRTGRKAYLSLPAIMRDGEILQKDDNSNPPIWPDKRNNYKNSITDLYDSICRDDLWDGIYVHNINQAYYLSERKDYKGQRIAGAQFYNWNTRAMEISRRQFGIDRIVLPYELGVDDLNELLISANAPELLIYGHIPLMVSAQCQKKNLARCDHKRDTLYLTDPRGRKLPVTNHCDFCYNKIWSHQPLNLMEEDLDRLRGKISRYTFDFFAADPDIPGKCAEQFENR
ncbi:MAG: U32 family peptidase [Eubacterium sp.]|nr:U32 family peptidase [Eubacterium sp.]